METNWNQLIERYLNNELSAEGKTAFEAELKQNKELQQEFELHKLTTELIQRNSLRRLVRQSGKWFHIKKLLIKAGIGVIIAGVLAASVYVILNWDSITWKPEFLEKPFLEKLEKELVFENIAPEYFQFTGESDVFLSESGVLLSITDESFLLNGKAYKGEAIVQWQEAQKASDIVKAGLSTKSGDRLLETQGMFSLNAFTPEGKKLQLTDKGVYVQVPVDELKKDMKLFTGIPGKNGGIDWQNPVELERLPKPKDMSEMDLYPPDYEPKLNELKWFTEKTKRDSLYLSFEEHLSEEFDMTQEVIDIAYPDYFDAKNIDWYNKPIDEYPKDPKLRGELLFHARCATCHMAHSDRTGPKLFRVRQKWAEGGAKEGSIYQWVADWSKAAMSDSYASEVSNIKPTGMMKFPELEGRTADIDAIFNYIDDIPFGYEMTDAAPRESYLIPPSKVLAIWNPKFNNTNLATQDFEDRMKVIHGTCDKKVLEVYVSNLNTSLWKLDERVVKMGYSQFQQFADQKVGVIKIDDAHQKNLNAFYKKAIETIRERGKKELETALKRERQWDKELEREREKEQLRKGMRESANLEEEYGFNLANVGKQLGKTLGFQVHGGGTVLNIDAYVREATVNRQSTVITDPETGKTAQITYEPMSVEVKNAEKYGRLYLYLFSKEINSYQRLDFRNGKLEYNLNGDMNYTAAVIGINETGYFYHQLNELKAGNLGVISLTKISEKEFEQKITGLNNIRTTKPMDLKDELNWLFKEKADYEVQKKRRENAAFRREVEPTVYKCQMELRNQ
ncbi:c-type cytochrome [uncultured Fluviicola sp.]|uniref:c-type cytochrome n=1 Tax=uncultured Fluviicola sp. TaxID=463303 RepID=UPI0025D3071F|nr:c-type cytochrome [uncultured Fluviicola sp.]